MSRLERLEGELKNPQYGGTQRIITPEERNPKSYTRRRIEKALKFQHSRFPKARRQEHRLGHQAWLAVKGLDVAQREEDNYQLQIRTLRRRFPQEWRGTVEGEKERITHEVGVSIVNLNMRKLEPAIGLDLNSPVVSGLFINDGFVLLEMARRLTGEKATTIHFLADDGHIMEYAQDSYQNGALRYRTLAGYYTRIDKWSKEFIARQNVPLATVLRHGQPLLQVDLQLKEMLYESNLARMLSGAILPTYLIERGKLVLSWQGNKVGKDGLIDMLKEIPTQHTSETITASIGNDYYRPNLSVKNW